MASFKRSSFLLLPVVTLASAFMVGCAGPAPNYVASIDNVQLLKNMDAAGTNVGAFVPKAGLKEADSIGLRAASMTSPVGKHYGDYLAQALRSELEMAKLYDAASPIEVSGMLLDNTIHAAGISTNDGRLQAQFVVKSHGTVRYDKIKTITREWKSSFVGSVAIPLAASNYPLMVQQLLGELFADPDFVAAVKKR